MKLWQKVIYVNYGACPARNIAKVIGTDEQTVIENAKKLGLSKISFNPDWLEKGFVTIIRNNWDLLSEEDIATLIGISLKELKTLLVEYDFLDIKLGEKPKVEKISYSPLTSAQEKETEKIKVFTEENFIEPEVKPFDFFKNCVPTNYVKPESEMVTDRFTSSYNAKYSGSLLDDNLSDYPDEYLMRLKASGTNGIWLSDTLRNLAEFPFDKRLSTGYEIRIANLKKLTERCEKYGIGVYLYINEPRSLPESFFEKYPDMRGQRADDGTYCLCTSNSAVLDYVYTAIKSIAKSVPLLKALLTITMSENPTHCYSRRWNDAEKLHTECPRCSKRLPEDMVSELNNVIAKALKDGNDRTKLIAHVWGWRDFRELSDDNAIFRCIDALDKDIEVLCVSEYALPFTRGGVDGLVGDYSISVVGPGEFAKKVLSYAKEKGHKIWAKVQFNNSWECSAVPYLPVFDLMVEHVENVKKLNVDGLMTGWSLGGFPGGALSLCNSACGKEKFDDTAWYNGVYEEKAKTIKTAVQIFSSAFREYPFSVDGIYFGGHNLGPANIWSLNKQNRTSSMVCFTFDDYETYVKPYGVDIYVNQLKKLLEKWEQGLKVLEKGDGNEAYLELKRCALAAYAHLKSSYNLTRFSKLKENAKENKDELLSILEEETLVTKLLYNLFSKDAKIGFEMTNHYYYNENLLLYKLINLKDLTEEVTSL